MSPETPVEDRPAPTGGASRVRRAVVAVAVVSLVGAAGAAAQEAPLEPAPSTLGDTVPLPQPAPPAVPEAPAPTAPPAADPEAQAPPAAAPAPAAEPAPSAVPSVAGTAVQPEPEGGELRAPRPSPVSSERAAARRAARAEARTAAAKRRRAARAAARARREAREGARADAPGSAVGGVNAPAFLTTFSLGAPIPSFLIERFRIPPFLLSIYQAAGIQYGVRWEVLAAINEIETDYGRNLNVSSAGAQGWMQFMPATWRAYGTDANDDGTRDPYNPVDAIFAAARYLKAAGYEQDVRKAIFAYNHADWYVNSVLARARLITLLPTELVGALTGLTEGRFPVAARASYATRATPAALAERGARRRTLTSQGSELRTELELQAERGAPVVAVQDGRITRIGKSPELGRFLQLRDVHGNTYTYLDLGSIAKTQIVPRAAKRTAALEDDAVAAPVLATGPGGPDALLRAGAWARPVAADDAELPVTVYSPYQRRLLGGLEKKDVRRKALGVGSTVVGGTVLGRVGGGDAPHVRFRIRPAGKGAPLIDPTPILDGWRLLDSTAVYRATGRGALRKTGAQVGRILLESKERLVRRVLDDPDIELYSCGRRDVAAGLVDRRVLATLALLSAEGLDPTVSSLRCGHGRLTSSGNVSEHTTGTAVDISAVNGIPIMGHQGTGSITETVVRKLLTLQGTMKPHQVISLLDVPGAANTLALADHDDHIHVGWTPRPGQVRGGSTLLGGGLRGSDWDRLMARLNVIENPLVAQAPSGSALPPAGR